MAGLPGGEGVVVYADEVFFVNAAVDLLLLLTARALTDPGTRLWRLWAGAAFGGLAAVAACLPGLGWLARLPGATLSFLGLGLRSPATSWGVLLQETNKLETIMFYNWKLIPMLFVFLSVLAFNFMGDGLRDAADPYK